MLPHNPVLLALLVFKGEFCPEIQLHNIPKFCRAQLVGTIQQIGQFFQSLSWWTTELSVWFGLKNVRKPFQPKPVVFLPLVISVRHWRSQ